jgi:hypothetical protein
MWKDISGYSQSDKVREPKTLELKVGGLEVVVTKHIHYGDEIILRCMDVGINEKALGVTTLEEAKIKAIDVVENKLKKMQYAISQARIYS